jgi:hypothetical protein
MVKVKGARAFVQGIDHHAYRRNLRRIPQAPVQGVHQQKSSEMLTAAGTGNRQAT